MGGRLWNFDQDKGQGLWRVEGKFGAVHMVIERERAVLGCGWAMKRPSSESSPYRAFTAIRTRKAKQGRENETGGSSLSRTIIVHEFVMLQEFVILDFLPPSIS